jgi:hypothetical protein
MSGNRKGLRAIANVSLRCAYLHTPVTKARFTMRIFLGLLWYLLPNGLLAITNCI